MTAEVAVMNRSAVALAADSAMTVGGPYGTKIYNTVNKLFTLSKVEPVGAMVYSRANVMGVPAETVIKWFRNRRLGTACCQHLPEYSDSFLSFLSEDQTVFPLDVRVAHCREIASLVFSSIAGRVLHLRDAGVDEDDRLLSEWEEHIVGSPELPGVTADVRERLGTDLAELVGGWKVYFEQDLGITDASQATIQAIAVEFFLREALPVLGDNQVGGAETGFVIAGFGHDDFFPRLRNFELISSVYGVTKMVNRQTCDISPGNGAAIMPFAQKDMIETFVAGRAHSFDLKLGQFLAGWFDEQVRAASANQDLESDARESLVDALHGIQRQVQEHVANELSEWTTQNHVGPLLDTISVLPKEDLAVIAEALINLTIHKRRATPDAETVGPPTDVAVISKGDGFIWIRRKHYFEPELNQHFMPNYFRGFQNE